eukprot:1145962-Amphidinium_carterae.1
MTGISTIGNAITNVKNDYMLIMTSPLSYTSSAGWYGLSKLSVDTGAYEDIISWGKPFYGVTTCNTSMAANPRL